MHLERNMEAADQFEIMRLVKDFSKGYDKKYKTKSEIVFSALFGIKMAKKELNL